MRQRLITIPLMCGALLSLAACGHYAIPDSTPLSQSAAANPFEDEAEFLAALTHGSASPSSRIWNPPPAMAGIISA